MGLITASHGLQQFLLGSLSKLKPYRRRSSYQSPLEACLVLQLADEVLRSSLPGEVSGGEPS